MTRALIFGISGQDGAYLAQLLLRKGYDVHGASRDADVQQFSRLKFLGVHEKVRLHSASMRDFRDVLQTIDTVRPDEVYNLAGQSSVALSFSQPIETMETIAQAQLLVLEAIRYLHAPIRLYNACSSECFGDVSPGSASDERSQFVPRSPYATAKASAHWSTVNYRDAYGIFACSGILFNHESPLRSDRFVTKKIVAAAARIAGGSRERIALGNLRVARDWGYAPEYVEAMWRMLQQETAYDFVIATGESHTLEEFTAATFAEFGLDWSEHVDIDPALLRPADIGYSCGNPSKAWQVLGWKAKTRFADLIRILASAERAALTGATS